jgi:ATP-binding cassette subfamily B protein
VRYQLSAADNIGLGRSAALADREAIITAASAAGADEFLGSLTHGYETMLSKAFGGVDLSIGQWQRVALARAFFRNAPFIVLDEPTASLDARAEHALFDTIRGLRQGRTVLLISHRFSTVRSADRIYVLKDGTIVEGGNHDELMAFGGLYAELYSLQASTTLNSSVTPLEAPPLDRPEARAEPAARTRRDPPPA